MAKWSEGLQRYLARDDISLKTSGAETTSTTGQAQELGDYRTVSLVVDITAASGTPTMELYIEGSDNNIDWHTIARIGSDGYRVGSVGTAPANFTTTDTERMTIPAARYMRYRSVIGGGTPSLTYSIGGTKA